MVWPRRLAATLPAAGPRALLDNADNDDDKDGEHKHAGEDAGDVEDAFRLRDQVTKARRSAEIFTDDRAGRGKATEVGSDPV